ncbi:hypothetical protein SDC9_131891 [bioreactor metagenome]|uniref:Uncharacterized protein n=1 Tax=bioreactor metagenome TaxID=1076179 RepID=A0A645D6J5_9ZZZZ
MLLLDLLAGDLADRRALRGDGLLAGLDRGGRIVQRRLGLPELLGQPGVLRLGGGHLVLGGPQCGLGRGEVGLRRLQGGQGVLEGLAGLPQGVVRVSQLTGQLLFAVVELIGGGRDRAPQSQGDDHAGGRETEAPSPGM